MITAIDHTLRKELSLSLVEYSILEYITIGGMKKYKSVEIGEALGVTAQTVSSAITRLAGMSPPLLVNSDGELFVTGTWRELLLGEKIEISSSVKKLTEEVVALYNEMFDSDSRPPTWESDINALVNTYKKLHGKDLTIVQFKAVFEFKKNEWSGGEMAKYLKLSTLIKKNNFIKYLEEARAHYIKTKTK